ncbi:Plus3 domain-containing protein [Meloidogyne graminicola]|uniref:Plus3 domain-containing protein n=1 Tax=Meloidogyne graminicola TaxID=189291 RepID=A0A8S9ZNZ1_9BILA|nr:Plus3 domain-containing protein [Meloidogyne graminicola]
MNISNESNFEDGMQECVFTNNSLEFRFTDGPSEKIRACILGRERLLKLFATPYFARTVVNCFVRFVDQNNSDDSKFKIARVTSVLDGPDHGYYNDNIRTLLQLDDKSEVSFDVISEEPAMEDEIQNWLRSLLRKNIPTPTIAELDDKISEISLALSWPFSPSEKQMELDNNGSNEKAGWQYLNSDFELNNNVGQTVTTNGIECLENGNECQIEQGVAENIVIDGTTGEQLIKYEELLEIFLRRSQLIRIIQQQNFSKTVIGSFVRFLYSLPSSPRTELSLSKDKLRYKIMQIVGVHKCEEPYFVGRTSVDKELKIECDKVIIHCKISSVSDSVPTKEEFDGWMSTISNKHSESTIPSIHFIKSKALEIKTSIDAEKDKDNNNIVHSTPEQNKNVLHLEIPKTIVSKLHTRSQNNTPNKSRVATTTLLAPRISFSSPAIIDNPTTSSSTQRPKGFEIFKRLKNGLSEEHSAKKTSRKEQPLKTNPQKDEEFLFNNGFNKKVEVLILKEEVDKSFEFAMFEISKKLVKFNKCLNNKATKQSRKRAYTSGDNKCGNLQNNSVKGNCSNVNIGGTIKNVEGKNLKITSSGGLQQQRNPLLPNKLKMEVIEIDESNG